ncbi:MAG: hypothetical protein ACRDLC_04470, partial [Actinomycetota bacterium]
ATQPDLLQRRPQPGQPLVDLALTDHQRRRQPQRRVGDRVDDQPPPERGQRRLPGIRRRLRPQVEREPQPGPPDLGPEAPADARQAALAALGRGLVVNPVTDTALRLAPPLVVTEDEIDEGLARLGAALEEAGLCR